MTEATLILKRLSEYSNAAEFPSHLARHHKDRRFTNSDRRQCHTYLAKDRRSGLAERRERPPSIYSLVQFLRQKLLKNHVVFSSGKGSQYG